MTLAPGRRLGPYEITGHIGAGGMGEVYRARDSRLKRDVAIKVLPAFVGGHPDRVSRFQREAEMLAALNHPNIAHIHGIEDTSGVFAIVMEFVDGPTLSDRILQSPGGLSPLDIVKVATQIASALEAAHDRGIVHRDLKPANIKIAAGGNVKLLDFGLAKDLAADVPDLAAETMDLVPRTQVGAILGTAAYMSPEQAMGEAVDPRTDLFSFGAVLYEMATGRRAFDGANATAILDAVLHKTPRSPRSINARVPVALDRLILRLLEKDRASRPQHAVEVGDDLRRLERSLDVSGPDHTGKGARKAPIVISIASFAAILALGAGVWIRWRPVAPALARSADYVQVTAFANSATSPSFSRDGRMVTFVQGADPFFGAGQVFVKALPDGEPVQLTNDRSQKMSPVFSPDGSQVAYTTVTPPARWDTWIVPALGGTPRPWLKNAAAVSWTRDKQLIFSEITNGIRMRVATGPEDRANSREIYTPETAQGMAHRSALSPDGKSVLIVEMDKGSWLP
jgi:serine/threonine protein kinase